MKTTCVFGDSIAWGAYDPKNGGWVNLLRGHLEPQDISVYNCGVSGNNTDDLLERFKVEAKARKPERIIFAIGINDSQYIDSRDNTRVPEDKFVKNLETLIGQAKEFTDEIVFLGLTQVEESKVMPIPWSDENKNYGNTNVGTYNSLIEEVANKFGIPFVGILDLLKIDELEDGLHPNSKGHEKIFQKVKDFLVENKWV